MLLRAGDQMTRYEANKYEGYARECLRQAEVANTPDAREKLIELSRIWMKAALNEERLHMSAQLEELRSSEGAAAADCLPAA
jgi:hypothetical protein